jgi:hypothetical protein
MYYTNNKILVRSNIVFLVKTNNFYWIYQQKSYWTKYLGSISTKCSANVKPTQGIPGVFFYLIENQYRFQHFKYVSV